MTAKWMKNNNYLLLFLIFTIAIAIRFSYVTVFREIFLELNRIRTNPDTWSYLSIAERLLKCLDYGRDLDRPPLYPHFLFTNFLLFGLSLKTVRVVQAILDSLTCVILALIGKNLCGRGVGILTGLGSAFYPFFILNTGEIMTETLFMFLFSSFILFFLYLVDSQTMRYAVLSGMSLGLAILCRATVIFLPPLLIVWFLVWSPLPFSKRVTQLLLTLVCMVLVISPWTIRNYLIVEKFIPVSTTGGLRFYMGNSEFGELEYLKGIDPLGTTWARAFWKDRERNLDRPESWYYKKGWEYIQSHPKNFLKLMMKKGMIFWIVIPSKDEGWVKGCLRFVYYGGLPLLGIIGLFLYIPYSKRKFSLFLLFFTSFTIVHMLTVSAFRFRVSLIDPYLITFTFFFLTNTLPSQWQFLIKRVGSIKRI